MQTLRLNHKHVLLGVTGSIAAYKACEMVRLLKKEGAEVQVVMTEAAKQFVRPLTFETLSGCEVVHELFPENRVVKTRHVSLADWADCVLICPATANCIGKLASGIADDFLTTVVLASRAPVLLAPAMDHQMIGHPVTTQNLDKLKAFGYRMIESEEGELASGQIGLGRLAGLNLILDAVKQALIGTETLKGVRVLVTAGSTREPIDPVRFLSNRSSGKMGFALAEEAELRGADVTLVSGSTIIHPFRGIRWIKAETAKEMEETVLRLWKENQILVMAAAVADYRPRAVAQQKQKKDSAGWSLELEQTADILAEAAKDKGDRLAVGFALETENGEVHALTKLQHKRLDLICLNNPFDPDSGFETDTTRLTLFDRYKERTQLPLMTKWEAAAHIWNRIEILMKQASR